MNELRVGDTIQCHNGADMINTSIALAQEGVIVKHLGKYKLEVVVINHKDSELEE